MAINDGIAENVRLKKTDIAQCVASLLRPIEFRAAIIAIEDQRSDLQIVR